MWMEITSSKGLFENSSVWKPNLLRFPLEGIGVRLRIGLWSYSIESPMVGKLVYVIPAKSMRE